MIVHVYIMMFVCVCVISIRVIIYIERGEATERRVFGNKYFF